MALRITSVVLVMLLLMNGTVTVMAGSGLTDDLGVELAPGVEQEMDNLIEHVKAGFEPGGGLGDTLFGLFAAAGSAFSLLVTAATSAPAMFSNLGFPDWIVYPFFTPLYLISFLDLIYAFTQRAL